jgi:PAS domain S-box-containing protein
MSDRASQEELLAHLIEAEGGDATAQNPSDLGDARCSALVRVLASAVWLCDPQGRLVSRQKSWAAFTGQDWEEYRAYGWLEAVHREDRRLVISLLRKARGELNLFSATVRLWNTRHGGYRWCEMRGVPVLGPGGEVSEWVGTCLDIDDKVRAEQELLDADRRKDEFMATLAHELRNPLAPMLNAVHILERRGHDDPQLAWARDIIARQIEQASRLLDDLLDASRIKEGKVALRKSRITLGSVLEQAVEVSRPLLEQHGHCFELDLPAGPVYLDADPARLVQVFTNLLNNAAKYTEPGGWVRLALRVHGHRAVVSVADTGIGLDPDMRSRIFDVFTQVESGAQQAQGGLGIGLAVVTSLVELHGGEVEARSKGLGRGSEFLVRLPISLRRTDRRRGPMPQD